MLPRLLLSLCISVGGLLLLVCLAALVTSLPTWLASLTGRWRLALQERHAPRRFAGRLVFARVRH